MSEPPVRLWIGRTAHRRETPFVRAFSHAIAMIDIDIDRLAEASHAARLFSVNGPNLVAFHEQDYGPRETGADLRAWAEKRLADAGAAPSAELRVITFPRILGYGFAPISIWLSRDAAGELNGVIYEVHNTFGETHAYVAASPTKPHEAEKAFFVSPFFDVSGQYRFTLRPSAGRFELIVENIGSDGRRHVASLLARPHALHDLALLGWMMRLPLSGLGVALAIHWQALMLWMRGARYHSKPAPLAERTTKAKPAGADVERLRKRA